MAKPDTNLSNQRRSIAGIVITRLKYSDVVKAGVLLH